MEQSKIFEGWYIVEQMGHKRLAGFVQEVQIAGCGFLRVDVPDEGNTLKVSQFILPSTIYCLTPCVEAIAREVARRINPTPPGVLQLSRTRSDDESDYEDEW